MDDLKYGQQSLIPPCPPSVSHGAYLIPYLIALLLYYPNTRLLRTGLYPLGLLATAWAVLGFYKDNNLGGAAVAALNAQILVCAMSQRGGKLIQNRSSLSVSIQLLRRRSVC